LFDDVFTWLVDLFPIPRSITGNGVRETLSYFKKILPNLQIVEVPTGTKAFDWSVPKEWIIREAYIQDLSTGERFCEFKKNNLHVFGYSQPVNEVVSLDILNLHLKSIPENPEAIPYITSYYSNRWGFCISEKDRKKLNSEKYKVYIDSEFIDGSLTYAELLIPGESTSEILISTYICHPSMANNELSGPVVTAALASIISELKSRYYSYRFVFVPETIGSIVYINKNIDKLKNNVIAGYVITCVGDEKNYSFLPSRYGATFADKISLRVLQSESINFKSYSFLERGSDERQYCSPGVDLPVCSIMRSMYTTYAEYHTSLDNLSFVTSKGLNDSIKLYKNILITIEKSRLPLSINLCEPQMGKRGLYSTLGGKVKDKNNKLIMNILAYCDGKNDILMIAEIVNEKYSDVVEIINLLTENNLIIFR
jgi:aminopeptidase-like protein